MRREKFCYHPKNPIIKGSPPHAQGKGKTELDVKCKVRITPACAGKRLGCVAARASIWDHPRMRREKVHLI